MNVSISFHNYIVFNSCNKSLAHDAYSSFSSWIKHWIEERKDKNGGGGWERRRRKEGKEKENFQLLSSKNDLSVVNIVTHLLNICYVRQSKLNFSRLSNLIIKKFTCVLIITCYNVLPAYLKRKAHL